MKCINCGHDLPGNAKFCTKCGTHVELNNIRGGQDIQPQSVSDSSMQSVESNEERINSNVPISDPVNQKNDDWASGFVNQQSSQKAAFIWKDSYTYIGIVVAIIIAAGVGFAVKLQNAKQDNDISIADENIMDDFATQGDDLPDELEDNIEDSIDENTEDNSDDEDLDDSNDDVENVVLDIREQYNNIIDDINSDFYLKKDICDGGIAYIDGADVVKAIVLSQNAGDSEYAQSYYYNEYGNLIFAYYEAKDSHRLYFSDSELVRWRYCEDASDVKDVVDHDYEGSSEFADWEYIVRRDSDYYLQIANTCSDEDESDDYVWPGSDSRYMTKSDLKGFSKRDCWLARNELYARHGRKFDDKELQKYFKSKDWYKGTINPDDFSESILNDFEIHNRDLIVDYEQKKGYR